MTVRRSPLSRWTRNTLRVEELENRIVPAAYLLNKYQVMWQDLASGGNTVSVIATQPIFTDLATANSILTFNDGSSNGNEAADPTQSNGDQPDFVGSDYNELLIGTPGFLRKIDLTGVAAPGLSLSVVSTNSPSAITVVGYIETSVDLNKVVVQGRLMGITTSLPSNVAALTVTYLGVGDTTNPQDLGTSQQTTFHSTIDGNLGLFKILSGSATAPGAVDNGYLDVQGNIGQVVVLGNLGVDQTNLPGGYDVTGTDDTFPSAISANSIGSVQVRGQVFGSSALLSGSIFTQPTSFGPGGNINSVFVGGSVHGGQGHSSGQISAFRNINTIQVVGSLLGDGDTNNDFSGTIRSGWDASNQGPSNLSGDLPSVVIGGSLVGSLLGANNSGEIFAHGKIGQVQIKGSITGGTGSDSGRVHADLDFKSITVNGSVSGGPSLDGADSSGEISSYVENFSDATQTYTDGHNVLGSVRIGGNMVAGLGTTGGRIVVDGNLTSVTIAGNLQGGQVGASGNLGTINVKGSVLGGSGDFGGAFFAGVTFSQLFGTATLPDGGSSINAGQGTITSVTVGGSLSGGAGTYSGSVIAGDTIKTVKVGKDFAGGTTQFAGYIHAETVTSVTIGGTVKGGSDLNTGEISASSSLGNVSVNGDVRGGSGDASGRIAAYDSENSDSPVNLGNVTIGGNLQGGDGDHSGEVSATGNAGNITVKKSVSGGRGAWSGDIHAGVADSGSGTFQGTMGNVTIGGDLKASYFTDAGDYNGTVSAVWGLGKVSVGGSIQGGTASNAGGIFVGSDVNAATDETDDSSTVITIKSVTVGKSIIAGVNNSTTHDAGFIFSAGNIDNVTIGKDIDGSNGNQMDDFKQVSSSSARVAANGIIGTESGVFGNKGGVKVGGFLRGGNNSDTGEIISDANGDADNVSLFGDLVSVQIAKGIIGGAVFAGQSADKSGYIQGYDIGTLDTDNGGVVDANALTVGASGIVAGANNGASSTNNASIRATNDINRLTVNGSVSGNTTGSGGEARVVITAADAIGDGGSGGLAIFVKGSLSHADIGAGYAVTDADITTATPVIAAGAIGDVTVLGNWNSSNMLASVTPSPSDGVTGGVDFDQDTLGAGGSIGALIVGTATTGAVTSLDLRYYTIAADSITSVTVKGLAKVPGSIAGSTAYDLVSDAVVTPADIDSTITKGVLLYQSL